MRISHGRSHLAHELRRLRRPSVRRGVGPGDRRQERSEPRPQRVEHLRVELQETRIAARVGQSSPVEVRLVAERDREPIGGNEPTRGGQQVARRLRVGAHQVQSQQDRRAGRTQAPQCVVEGGVCHLLLARRQRWCRPDAILAVAADADLRPAGHAQRSARRRLARARAPPHRQDVCLDAEAGWRRRERRAGWAGDPDGGRRARPRRRGAGQREDREASSSPRHARGSIRRQPAQQPSDSRRHVVVPSPP